MQAGKLNLAYTQYVSYMYKFSRDVNFADDSNLESS